MIAWGYAPAKGDVKTGRWVCAGRLMPGKRIDPRGANAYILRPRAGGCAVTEQPLLGPAALSRNHRGIAQPGSAPALGAGCRGFKSLYPDHINYLGGRAL